MIKWFYQHGGNTFGPVTSRELFLLAESGNLLQTDMISKEGTVNWVPAKNVKQLFPFPSLKNNEIDYPHSNPVPPPLPDSVTSQAQFDIPPEIPLPSAFPILKGPTGSISIKIKELFGQAILEGRQIFRSTKNQIFLLCNKLKALIRSGKLNRKLSEAQRVLGQRLFQFGYGAPGERGQIESLNAQMQGADGTKIFPGIMREEQTKLFCQLAEPFLEGKTSPSEVEAEFGCAIKAKDALFAHHRSCQNQQLIPQDPIDRRRAAIGISTLSLFLGSALSLFAFRIFPALAWLIGLGGVDSARHLPDDTVAAISIDLQSLMAARPSKTTVGEALLSLAEQVEILKVFTGRLNFNPVKDATRLTIALAGKEETDVTMIYGKWDVEAFNEHFPRLVKTQTGIEVSSTKVESIVVHHLGSSHQRQPFVAVVNGLCAMSSKKERVLELIQRFNANEKANLRNEAFRNMLAKVDQSQTVWFVISNNMASAIPAVQGVPIPVKVQSVRGGITLKRGITFDVTREGISKEEANDSIDKLETGLAWTKQGGKSGIPLVLVLYLEMLKVFTGFSAMEFLNVDENEAALEDFFRKAKFESSTDNNTMKVRFKMPWSGR